MFLAHVIFLLYLCCKFEKAYKQMTEEQIEERAQRAMQLFQDIQHLRNYLATKILTTALYMLGNPTQSTPLSTKISYLTYQACKVVSL